MQDFKISCVTIFRMTARTVLVVPREDIQGHSGIYSTVDWIVINLLVSHS